MQFDRRSTLQGVVCTGALVASGCGEGSATPTPPGSGIPPPGSGAPPSHPVGITIDVHVDAAAGSDGNPGSAGAPVRSFEHARTLAPAGGVIGLRTGQTHFRAVDRATPDTVTLSVVGYGSPDLPATISGGQSLSGHQFSDEGGGIFKARIRLPVPHTPGGSGISATNTTYPFVRLGETYFEWIVGKPSQAENLEMLAAASGPAYCIFGAGSKVPDIRDESSGLRDFDIYVRLDGGANPTGQPIVALANPNTYVWGGALLQDVAIRDAWSKDTTGSDPHQSRVPVLRRVESIGGGCHGWVGSCNVDGFRARGIGRPGMFGYDRGWAAGGGLNMYSATDRRDQTFTLSGLEIEGFGNALYGHAGAGLFANALVVESTTQPGFAHFRVRNCGVAIAFDPAAGEPAMADGLSVRCEIDVVEVDRFLQTESRANIERGGKVTFSEKTVGGHSISLLYTSSARHYIQGVAFSTPRARDHSFGLDLAQAVGSAVGSASLMLENCKLPIHPDHAFCLGRRSQAEGQVFLHVAGSTEIGDPVLDPDRLPAGFSARGSSVIAFADQSSRQAIRDFLASKNVGATIDNSVTVIRRDGSVAERGG